MKPMHDATVVLESMTDEQINEAFSLINLHQTPLWLFRRQLEQFKRAFGYIKHVVAATNASPAQAVKELIAEEWDCNNAIYNLRSMS
jgi:hypothetical protein